ncbi:MAG: maleylpyruvate isomerase family mycothiol-dependent enzyme [Actinomycetota bacterium]|nr:maleylpyruvate isomerase family mycothiol-dependent enzyme [Actinomycetota bacterium]
MKYTSSFIVSALRETWFSLDGYCSQLAPEQWEVASDCPGWSVKDVLAHVVGTERQLLGDRAPILAEEAIGGHVKNEIGRSNEAWVESMRSRSGTEVLSIFESTINARLDALDALSDEEFDADSWLPVGKGSYRDFMAIRVMDCFVHEQDIRISTGGSFLAHERSGRIALDQLLAGLPYVIGKKVKPLEGTTIRVDVTSRSDTIASVRVRMQDGRASVVQEADAIDDAVLRCTFEAYLFAAAGRLVAPGYLSGGSVAFEGDEGLALQVFENLGFVI